METIKKYFIILPLLLLIGCKNQQKKAKDNTQISPKEKRDMMNDTLPKNTVNSKREIGVGPVKHVRIPDTINHSMAAAGKKLFYNNCASCHRFDEVLTGPALGGVLQERTPEWVMNMILNTNEMLAKDPLAMSMLGEYQTRMVDTGLSRKQARAIVEFFRSR